VGPGPSEQADAGAAAVLVAVDATVPAEITFACDIPADSDKLPLAVEADEGAEATEKMETAPTS